MVYAALREVLPSEGTVSSMEFVPVLALVLLVKKILDFLRYATNGNINGVVTQLISWLAGIGAVVLVAQTDWASGINVGDATLSTLNFWSLLFVGLTISSGASVVHDVTKAVDGSDSAKIPTLIPSE